MIVIRLDIRQQKHEKLKWYAQLKNRNLTRFKMRLDLNFSNYYSLLFESQLFKSNFELMKNNCNLFSRQKRDEVVWSNNVLSKFNFFFWISFFRIFLIIFVLSSFFFFLRITFFRIFRKNNFRKNIQSRSIFERTSDEFRKNVIRSNDLSRTKTLIDVFLNCICSKKYIHFVANLA